MKTCIDYKCFEPKDKQMENRVIFESEEEAKEHYKKIFPQSLKVRLNESDYSDFLNIMANISKSNGYIRKSAVGEAEEMWDKMGDRKISVLEYKQREAIQEQHIKLSEKNRIIAKLEDEIERLKK